MRNEALVERDSGGCGRWREQQQLSDRRGTRRRPSTAELGGNLLRCGDGPDDAHGPAAAGANGDVDAEDAGEELHPRQARGGSVAELSVQQGGDGGELDLAARDEEGQLLRRGFGLVGTRHDGGPEFDSVSAVIDLDPQTRAGILTQVAFLTSTAHAAEPSWVYRGKFVRENLFCDHLPAPPPGVEVNDPNDPGRLENPSCSSCHLLIDPIGWTFDEYDALGGFRALDPDGQPYDTQGEVVGKDVGAFDGPVDLAHRLAESQDVADCYAQQWMKFANRRDVGSDDACVLDVVRESFSDSGHDIRKLIIAIATTEAFRYRRPAALEEEEE